MPGKINKVDLREIWPNEASDFTPWLADNLEMLGAELGMHLELVEHDAAVGECRLDILAKDTATGQAVVIENQYGETDHDHFGKLLTYAAGYNGSVIIWIAESICEEHRQALDWLNQNTDSCIDIFGVVIEVLRINESKEAPQFKFVVTPQGWQKDPEIRKNQYYFRRIIDELNKKPIFANLKQAQIKKQTVSFHPKCPAFNSGLI